ncbi:expressed unknown protein [Seminavis robusta]|uniref:POPDC1-3 domain-containing protein n=1 Tax=Seminavis robusta TaxID=568900 RepID=A0A9N8EGM1_9STRA|nr:expressed unknown protein [Seminavis robusta]|eukprot:Sro916_g219810.1 n/a (475) ;mRNA; r:31094-32518
MLEFIDCISLVVHAGFVAFLFSSATSDLLVMRLLIQFGWGCFLLPCIPTNLSEPICWTGIFWPVINLYINGCALLRLLMDEKPVHMKEEEEALWRVFYRLGGVSKMIFYHVVARNMEVVHYNPDDDMPTSEYLFIVYRGSCHVEIRDSKEKVIRDFTAASLVMFDLKHMDLLHGQKKDTYRMQATCKTHVTALRFPLHVVKEMTHTASVKGAWQNLLIENLSSISLDRYRREGVCPIAVDPLFAPLEDWEVPDASSPGSGLVPQKPFSHLWAMIRKHYSLPWPFGEIPVGLRHIGLPAPDRHSKSLSSSLLLLNQSKHKSSKASKSRRSKRRSSFSLPGRRASFGSVSLSTRLSFCSMKRSSSTFSFRDDSSFSFAEQDEELSCSLDDSDLDLDLDVSNTSIESGSLVVGGGERRRRSSISEKVGFSVYGSSEHQVDEELGLCCDSPSPLSPDSTTTSTSSWKEGMGESMVFEV